MHRHQLKDTSRLETQRAAHSVILFGGEIRIISFGKIGNYCLNIIILFFFFLVFFPFRFVYGLGVFD